MNISISFGKKTRDMTYVSNTHTTDTSALGLPHSLMVSLLQIYEVRPSQAKPKLNILTKEVMLIATAKH